MGKQRKLAYPSDAYCDVNSVNYCPQQGVTLYDENRRFGAPLLETRVFLLV